MCLLHYVSPYSVKTPFSALVMLFSQLIASWCYAGNLHDLIVKDLNQIVSKENIKLTERHLHTIEVYLVCSSWSYSA